MRHIEPGEVWIADMGMMAKIRPVLVLTGTPAADELALVTVIFHTTQTYGSAWELEILKPWLKRGVFHLQQIYTAPVVKFERRLGKLTLEELETLKDRLRERLDL